MNHKKKILIVSLLTILIFLCAGGIVLFFLEQRNSAGTKNSSEPEETAYDEFYEEESGGTMTPLLFGDDWYSTTDKISTYLLIGTDDSGTGAGTEGTEDYQGTMADFLLLLVYDKTQNTYGFLQLDRNTIAYVDVLDENNEILGGTEEQICCAHAYGTDSAAGCKNTAAAVGYLLGDMEVDGYYAISMDSIGTLNGLVGGVEVTLEDDFSKEDPAMTAGTTLTLDDEQAEIYVRARMELADDTNVNRMKRQKQYLTGLLAELKTKVQTDPACVNEIFKEFQDTADTNIKSGKLSKLAIQLEQAEDLGIFTLEGDTQEGNILDDGELHEEFYPTMESEIEVMSKLMHLTKDED